MKTERGQSIVESLLVLTSLGGMTFLSLSLIGSMVSERWLSKLAYDYLDCRNLKKPQALCFQNAISGSRRILPLVVTKIETKKSEEGTHSTIRAHFFNKNIVGHGFFPNENFKRTSADNF